MLSHSEPKGDLLNVMKRGLESLREQLLKTRFGVGRKPRRVKLRGSELRAASEHSEHSARNANSTRHVLSRDFVSRSRNGVRRGSPQRAGRRYHATDPGEQAARGKQALRGGVEQARAAARNQQISRSRVVTHRSRDAVKTLPMNGPRDTAVPASAVPAISCRRDARFCSRLGAFLRNGLLDRTPRPTRLAAHTFGARTAVTRFASPARGLSRRVEVPPGSPRQIRSRAAIAPERDHESPGRRRPRACCCSPPSGTFFSGELHRIPRGLMPANDRHTERPFTQRDRSHSAMARAAGPT